LVDAEKYNFQKT